MQSLPVSEEQKERLKLLSRSSRDQFVFDKKRFAVLEEALESGPGHLDLFSGARGFARAFVREGCPWALCFDVKHSEREDLSRPETQSDLVASLRAKCFVAMGASPVCASFSTAITPPWRTAEYPAGRPGLTEEQRGKIAMGHEQLRFVLELAAVCLEEDVIFWIENPDGSWFWKQQNELSWNQLLGAHSEKLGDLRLDQCRFGTPWRKRTRFRTTCHLRGQRLLCMCQQKHVVLRGRCKEAKQNFTKLAEAYPRSLCSYLAGAFAIDLGYAGKRRKLDIAGCAKCFGHRIGEAANPGPRQPRARPEQSIYDVSLLEPSTVLMRAKFWKQFCEWVEREIGEGAAGHVVESPSLLVLALEGFGAHGFATGMPLLYYRQLIVHVQTEFPTCRPLMGSAWSLVSRWEIAEPTQHRTPIPESIVKALASLSLLWGWRRFACTVLLCFYGICRIGELLKAQRSDLLTPEDLLGEEADVLYLRIRVPKSRGRGPRVQYASCRDSAVVKLLSETWQDSRPTDLLYGSSTTSFRRRWDALLLRLGIGREHRLTPGSLRGGGAVAAHKRGVGIADLLWHMRLQHQRTLYHYLQETTAASILPALSHESREKIRLLRDTFEFLVS